MAQPIQFKHILPAHARTYRVSSNRNTGLIDLPEAVDALIDDKAYRPKFRKLIREGHLKALEQLAELAPKLATKGPASHWFAACTSKRNWERTLEWLKKLERVVRQAKAVSTRLGLEDNQLKPVYAACWRLGSSVMRHAVTAAEIGRDKYKFFCWLTR